MAFWQFFKACIIEPENDNLKQLQQEAIEQRLITNCYNLINELGSNIGSVLDLNAYSRQINSIQDAMMELNKSRFMLDSKYTFVLESGMLKIVETKGF